MRLNSIQSLLGGDNERSADADCTGRGEKCD